MDTKVNFTKIGFFIVLLFVLLLVFIFWLGKYGLEDKKYDYYTIYFIESVSGLNPESPIKYKGLDVGNVKFIKINQKNSEQIEILIAIKEGTPIKEDNFAVLSSLGITGLRYIELKGGSLNSKLLLANKKETLVIPSKQSVTKSLSVSIEDFKDILAQTKKLLSDENLNLFSQLIKNSSQSFKNIERFTEHLVKKEEVFGKLLEEFSDFATTSSDSAKTVQESAASFELLTKEMLKEIQNGSFNLKEVSKESLDSLNSVLNKLDNTLIQTQSFIERLENSPSDLIFKQQSIEYGPGE